ncbi:hypothetical protein Tco_1204572 [Tanacetum coccineum]
MLLFQAANRNGCAVLTLLSLSWCDGWGVKVSKSAWVCLVNKLQARLTKWKDPKGVVEDYGIYPYVSSFIALNRALLFKWGVALHYCDGSLWCKVSIDYGSKFDLQPTTLPHVQLLLIKDVL